MNEMLLQTQHRFRKAILFLRIMCESTKKCKVCGGVKKSTEFYRDSSRKDNLRYKCIQCDKDFRESKQKVLGIYKITSPSGRVYIGESKDIEGRKNRYKNYNCKTQIRLYNSLNKYGWEQHTFEIVEECTEEDLKCKERYWQDFYNVIGKNGLNLKLTKCGEQKHVLSQISKNKIRNSHLKNHKNSDVIKNKISKTRIDRKIARGSDNPMSRVVINYVTLDTRDCAKYLVDILKINYSTLMCMLKGYNYNSTNWCFLEDFLDNSYSSNLKPTSINSGKEVICVVTLKTWRNITLCAIENSIDPQNLMRYLNKNNNRKNPTSFIYLEDYTY